MKKRTLIIISILGVLIISVLIIATISYRFVQKYGLMPPDTPEVREWLELGSEYSSQEKFKEAEDAFKKAIELDPDYELSHYLLGMCYYEQKRYDEATEIFNKVLKINTRYKPAQFGLETIEVIKEANISIELSELFLKDVGPEELSPEEKERYDYLTKQLEERREGKSFEERLKEDGIAVEDLIKEAMKDGMTREEAEELFLQ